jgi:phospholipase C
MNTTARIGNKTMKPLIYGLVICVLAIAGCGNSQQERQGSSTPDLSKIDNVVVIFGENRSFDNLYGTFPGAKGIADAIKRGGYRQVDRNGQLLTSLPPAWGA